MDCHKALFLGLVLLFSGAGCLSLPTTAPGGGESRADAEKRVVTENQALQDLQANSNTSKRIPKAETHVACGLCAERQASNQQMPTQQKAELRDNARESYQKALQVDPANKDAHLFLARLYMNIGDEDRAMATYQKAIAKLPRESVFYYDLGMIQSKRKNVPAAVEYLTKARALDPENREICTKLGALLALTNRPVEGVACLTPCLGKAEANFTVARILEHNGQHEASKQYLRVALQAKPDLQPAQEMLAMLEGKR